jgi:hypothetical protein
MGKCQPQMPFITVKFVSAIYKKANHEWSDTSTVRKNQELQDSQLLPIYLRVTIDGKRFEVATHRHVEPSEWSSSAGRVKSKSDTAVETNMALDMITKKVYEYREQLYFENRDFTVSSLREKWFGEDKINAHCLEYSDHALWILKN